jgi:hypothetical protein
MFSATNSYRLSAAAHPMGSNALSRNIVANIIYGDRE